jgi:CBS domain containing-hemolysin-like protein
MTPRTVMFVLDESLTVEKVFEEHPNIPFARVPITHESIDHISGLVRRRDLHSALVDGRGKTLIKDLAQEVNFVPENATADKALRLLLNEHCQLSVVVDEYGSVAGVLALEDIIESILGQEIFEHDDIAVDMRELAKRRNKSKNVNKTS